MAFPVFAADRIDTWVVRVSIAVPAICIGAMVLWHLVGYVWKKLTGKRKPIGESPEPPAALSERRSANELSAQISNDPERLQRACAALTDSLAKMYLELADCWQRRGQPQQASTTLQKLIQSCPDTPQAALARDRLAQFTAIEKHP